MGCVYAKLASRAFWEQRHLLACQQTAARVWEHDNVVKWFSIGAYGLNLSQQECLRYGEILYVWRRSVCFTPKGSLS